MSDPLEPFFGEARKIRLSESEREAGRKKLRIHVRNAGAERQESRMDENVFFRAARAITLTPRERVLVKERILQEMRSASAWWLHPFKHFTTVVASVLIVCVAGTSVSFAAESAMPGDLLYVVKMHVNEPIEMSMARTPEARANVAAKHAETRLHEAEMLAGKSALGMETQKMLAKEIQKNVGVVEREVVALMNAENLAAAGSIGMAFEAAIGAHTKLLAKLVAEHHGNESDDLMDTLHATRMSMEETAIVANTDPAILPVVIAAARTEVRTAQSEMPEDHRTLSAQEALTRGNESGVTAIEQLRFARTALRKAKEAAVFASMPPSPAPAPAAAPTVMMMKAQTASDTVSDSGDEDTDFDTAVRLRVTHEKIGRLRKSMQQHRESMPIDKASPVETRITGSEQLMDMAKLHREEGNMQQALDASDDALRHAKEAEKELQNLMFEHN